ncbi:MAG: poly-beta-1,6-N-acetyl-D-glucosamine biosynthesis protein PgaD [Gammaproteobacteria bacterium]|nr:poly-beta-1,6-N-acetyl-D-glucosamine biosynthesis protein PgaD [Gammaproteobacteria bacterium]
MVDSYQPPIISAPHLLSRRRQLRERVITALMWTLYAYLWTPLLSLLAWWTGLDIAYETMVENGGWEGLLGVARWYGISIGLIFVTIAVWSYSNRRRFRNKEKRQFIQPVSDQDLMLRFSVGSAQLELMRGAGIMVIDLDEGGNIVTVNAASMPREKTIETSAPELETIPVN